MQSYSPGPRQLHSNVRQDNLNFSRLKTSITRHWYYIAASLFLALAIAVVYTTKTIPTYRTSSSVLIEEGERTGMPDATDMLQGYGLQPGAQNLENQIQILTSWPMIERTLTGLGYEFNCYRKGFLKTVSYFPLNPIRVLTDTISKSCYNLEFYIKRNKDQTFQLAFRENYLFWQDTTINLGSRFSFGGTSMVILPAKGMRLEDIPSKKIYFVLNDMESLVESFRRRVRVERTGREGSVIRLTMEGTNKTKDLLFLDKLTRVFLMSNLEKKNHEANRIISFIDEQLVDVSDSLMITENQLQEFRSRNRIMDVSAQAQQIIDQAVVLENEKARLTLEANYYEYLAEYLSREKNEEVPMSPATMGIEDPVLGMLLQELAGLQAEYFSSGGRDMNPLSSQLEMRINNTKQSLRETLEGIIRANKMASDETASQINSINAQASRLPVKERQLLGFERKFNLNNVLYTFLLQTRAEAQIQKASNRPDNEIIEPARSEVQAISPNIFRAYPLAFLLGLGIPLFALFVIGSTNRRITSEEDIMAITSIPISGYIPRSKLSYQSVVLSEPQSQVAEAFRSLRSKMQFFTKETESPVILVSSSIPHEGKSFVSVNLASAYSLTGKKTIVVGFDLRRPNLSPEFGYDKTKGLSTFLIGKSKIQDIIHKTHYENLSILPSGPVPPNPAELIDTEKTKELMLYLKKHYDYIIVDSAPIGTVSDSYSLAALADSMILIVRNGRSMKRPFEATLAEIKSMGIQSISILVNDFKLSNYSYKYAYKYKIGYQNSGSKRKDLLSFLKF